MRAGTATDQGIGKSAMNKAFWRILPLILIAYLFVTVILNAPLILQDATTLDAKWIGYVVALGGISGAAAVLIVSIIAYLGFATICFTLPMLTSSGWAEVLHVRELPIGAAAINTISQIGAFAAPYGWGAAKDATGSFQPVMIGFSLIALVMSALILLLRHQVRERAVRMALA